MSLSHLLLRTKRKYRSDGLDPLLSEIATKALESDPVRWLVRSTLLTHGTVLEQSQLQKTAARFWYSDPEQTLNPFGTGVTVPDKTRLPIRGSFEELDTSRPTTSFVAELRDVSVLGPSGLGITTASAFIKDTVASDRSSRSRIEKILARSIRDNGYRRTRNTISNPGSDIDHRHSLATPLVPLWGNYYHWTLECLPKLLGVETYRDHTGESPTVLLPPEPSSWMRESLRLVGVDKQTTRTLNPGITQVDRFVVPSYPTPSRSECFWLRNRAYEHVDTQEAETPSRIYVSRRNANTRRIKNETDVLAVLSEYGFESVALETLTVAEQIRLFANAELVVSPHGAGLANLVYGHSPTVLEIFGYKQKTTFYRLAKLMGFEYHAMFCDHVRKDIVVDTEELKTKVDRIVSGEQRPVFDAIE